jgi:hypothetical protein
MKKLQFLLLAFVVFSFPLLAQELTEEVPVETLILKKGNIPPEIIKAADKLFQGSTQIEWGVFPYELKDYGWIVNKEYNEPINHYAIHMKGVNGSDIYAVFESTGELIRYRETKKDAPLPPPIMSYIQKSEYKDWKIVGDAMLVKSNQKKIVEHYAVKLQKDKKIKTLYFTPKGELLKS